MDFIEEDKQFDESQISLRMSLPKVGRKIEYEYDFGDGWRHEIKLEKKLAIDFSQSLECIAGEKACPPDDSGGVWGYIEMLEAVKDPKHPEHEDMTEWLGKKFDPEFFDLKKAKSKAKKEVQTGNHLRLAQRRSRFTRLILCTRPNQMTH